MKDLAFESKLRADNPQLYTKEYLIGYSDKYNPKAYAFSVEQLKNRINVNAYKGRKITITAYMHKNANVWEADNAFQQTIFIPDPNYKRF